MKIPAITGIIRRRILLNYRVDPDVVEAILPARFRPKIVGRRAIAGICLIRLEEIRPKGIPAFIGISSENSAHRIAVTWEDDDGRTREGVFVPRRDTDSRLNALAGGRVFPGVHHHSAFTVEDHDGRITLRIIAQDMGDPLVALEASETDEFPETSVFKSLSESSDFFEAGCIGYSSRPDCCELDGLLLKVSDWRVSPLKVDRVQSAFYDDHSIFPTGSIQFDHALLMRDIPHEWHSEPAMTTEQFSHKKPMMERMFWWPGIAALLFSSGSLLSNPSFAGIEGTTNIRAVSAGGNMAGAENNLTALHWDSNAGLTDIGHLMIPGYGPNHTTEVSGMSADGSVLVGSSSSYSNSWSKTQAYRWTQQGGFTPLVDLSVLESHAVGISEDGRTVAGWIIVETGQHAVLWRDGQEFLRLDAGTSFGGISRNGVWVTGVKAEANNVQPFRWSADTGLIFLGAGADGCYGRAISDDGNVVVGQGTGVLPFRWSTGGGMESLGSLTAGDQGYATALSADGKTVVGALFNTGAFIWTEANGLRDLKDFLQSDLSMDLSGWKLSSAWAITGDGLMIAGRGIKLKPYTQSGDAQGFIARLAGLPTPHIAIAAEGGSIQIEFDGVLQTSPDLMRWTDMEPQPSNPYLITPSAGQVFFRARSH